MSPKPQSIMTPRHQHLLGLLATAGGSLTFVVVVVAIEWLERQEWPALAMLGLAA